MKTQIKFKQTDNDDGIALVEGAITSLDQAKMELANKLDLPAGNSPHASQAEIDARLRNGGIEPASVTFHQIAE
jgi:hypothetical protein